MADSSLLHPTAESRTRAEDAPGPTPAEEARPRVFRARVCSAARSAVCMTAAVASPLEKARPPPGQRAAAGWPPARLARWASTVAVSPSPLAAADLALRLRARACHTRGQTCSSRVGQGQMRFTRCTRCVQECPSRYSARVRSRSARAHQLAKVVVERVGLAPQTPAESAVRSARASAFFDVFFEDVMGGARRCLRRARERWVARWTWASRWASSGTSGAPGGPPERRRHESRHEVGLRARRDPVA